MTTLRFPREVGWGNAMRWLLTGDEFDAAEAHRIGFVQEVTAPGEQLARALAIADTIAAQAPLGVYATLASSRLEITAGEEEAARRLLPDLATAQEQGLPDIDCGTWSSFAFPKGTPEAIARRLAEATNKALGSAFVRERLEAVLFRLGAGDRIAVSCRRPDSKGMAVFSGDR